MSRKLFVLTAMAVLALIAALLVSGDSAVISVSLTVLMLVFAHLAQREHHRIRQDAETHQTADSCGP